MTNEEKKIIESSNYEVIVVIGNGFDVNLGLKTKYSDFIQSSAFQEEMISNSLFKYLFTQYTQNNGWIDAEIELKNYTKSNPENYHEEFKILKQKLTQYLRKTTNPESIDYKKIYTIETEALKIIREIKDMNFLILNFNYTKTCEDILFHLYHGNNELYQNAKKRIIHVHGSIENNNIIFGIEDKANIDEKYIFLKKSVNPNFCILDVETILQRNSEDILFFGYSLGVTDYTYFKDFFARLSLYSIESGKSVIVFYYGQSNYFDIHKRIDEMSNKSISGIKQRNELLLIDLQEVTV